METLDDMYVAGQLHECFDKYILGKVSKVINYDLLREQLNDEFTDIIFFHENADMINCVEHIKNNFYKVYINDNDAAEYNIRRKLKIPKVLCYMLNEMA
jgi:hypothetical protein